MDSVSNWAPGSFPILATGTLGKATSVNAGSERARTGVANKAAVEGLPRRVHVLSYAPNLSRH